MTTPLAVHEIGAGPRVLMIHGSLADGRSAFSHQRPMASRFRLVLPDRRGFGESPDPMTNGEDWRRDADDLTPLLGEGAHLVGHSYGGVSALIAATRRPEAVLSLCVIEPPLFNLADDHPAARDTRARMGDALDAARDDTVVTRAFLQRFLLAVGEQTPVPAEPAGRLARHGRELALAHPPWLAEPDLGAIADAPFPVLLVSGGHDPGFDAVTDALATRIPRARTVRVPGGHNAQRAAHVLNPLLAMLWTAAERRRGATVGS